MDFSNGMPPAVRSCGTARRMASAVPAADAAAARRTAAMSTRATDTMYQEVRVAVTKRQSIQMIRMVVCWSCSLNER